MYDIKIVHDHSEPCKHSRVVGHWVGAMPHQPPPPGSGHPEWCPGGKEITLEWMIDLSNVHLGAGFLRQRLEGPWVEVDSND